MHSRRTVPIHRSAIAFARGARTGVLITRAERGKQSEVDHKAQLVDNQGLTSPQRRPCRHRPPSTTPPQQPAESPFNQGTPSRGRCDNYVTVSPVRWRFGSEADTGGRERDG